jgi:hypothetical protein
MHSPNRLLVVVLALASTALTFPTAAQARTAKPVRVYITVPVANPYWDSNIVPRYRYRPQDDRIDPYGPPVVPVIRIGSGEATLPPWYRWNWYW